MRVTLEVGKKFPEITGAASDAFAAEVAKAQAQEFDELVLDFAGTEMISSMALGTIFAAHQKLGEQGRRLRVINASEKVQRLMRMVNMTQLLDAAP